MIKILKQIKNLLKLRNYSPKTQKAYLLYIKQSLEFSNKYKLTNKNKAIEKFLLNKFSQKQSPQTINLTLNSIKIFLQRNLA